MTARAHKRHDRASRPVLQLRTVEEIRAALDAALSMARKPAQQAEARLTLQACELAIELVKTADLERQVKELRALLASKGSPK